MHFLQAIRNGFCDEGDQFSWKKLIKFSSAIAIGGAAAAFSVKPSGDAADTLIAAIEQNSGTMVVPALARAIKVIFQVANVGEYAICSTLSAMSMIEAYCGSTSEAEKFLKLHEATCGEKSRVAFRKIFNLCCAGAANVPTFLLTYQSSIALAILTSLANMGLSWMGINSIPLAPTRIHPARRIEIAYLNEQIEIFLQLSFAEQNRVLDEIDALSKQDDSVEKYKQIYVHLLNLAKPAQPLQENIDSVLVQEYPAKTCREKAVPVIMGIPPGIAEATFAEASGVGVARLFSNPTSPQAITAGISSAIFALLPAVGFGYTAGANAGKLMTSRHAALAHLALPKTREALKWLLNIVSVFGGGTVFTVASNAVLDLSGAANIQGPLRTILQFSLGGFCYAGAAIENGYYSLRIVDEIILYFAQRCGDEKIRRLVSFIIEMRKLSNTLAEMTEENYLELLKWKIRITPSLCASDVTLSALLHSIFANKLSEAEYKKLQHDLNDTEEIVKNRTTVAGYSLNRLFKKEEDENKQSELRHRHHQAEYIDIESQRVQSIKPGFFHRVFCCRCCPQKGTDSSLTYSNS